MGARKKTELTFEGAMIRLDEITAALDSKQVTLEESLKLYGESMELIAYCKGCLEDAEKKIMKVTAKGELEEFSAE